ncbi:MAG: hypothetical protein LBE37_13970 [Sphingobacterium sp.]|jgi:ATP-dependent phosphoenolpyruvate carboxykinase|nr:hypothetical protein [Sphingobacterium sp.]
MIRELLGLPIYYKTKISQTEFKTLQGYAVDHLGVKNIYALRDKFEGERYYNQFLQRSFAELAFQNYIGESFFQLEEKSNKDFKPDFALDNKKVEVIDCSFEEYPKIPAGDYDSLIFCFVNLSSRDVWIAGSLDRDTAMKESNQNLLSPMFRKSFHGVLKNLTILEAI